MSTKINICSPNTLKLHYPSRQTWHANNNLRMYGSCKRSYIWLPIYHCSLLPHVKFRTGDWQHLQWISIYIGKGQHSQLLHSCVHCAHTCPLDQNFVVNETHIHMIRMILLYLSVRQDSLLEKQWASKYLKKENKQKWNKYLKTRLIYYHQLGDGQGCANLLKTLEWGM
jgi:hypothetical protein